MHPRGEIELHGRRLERFEINPPDGSAARFIYTYLKGPRSEKRMIESNRFDGESRPPHGVSPTVQLDVLVDNRGDS